MKLGKAEINSTGHSGIKIETENKKIIYIDPYNLEKTDKKADLILITHPHYDHCSIQDIEAVAKNGTVIILPVGCQSKITRINKKVDMQIIEVGDEIIVKEIKVQAVPAYNLNKAFHPKNEGWLGYIVRLDGLEIYHAGDTDLIPEMEKLVGYHELIALLPIGGKFTMDAEQAAEAALIIKPKLAVPIHFGKVVGSLAEAEKFVELCKQKGVEARIL